MNQEVLKEVLKEINEQELKENARQERMDFLEEVRSIPSKENTNIMNNFVRNLKSNRKHNKF